MRLEPLYSIFEVYFSPGCCGLITKVIEVVSIGEAVLPWSKCIIEGLRLDLHLEAVRVLVRLNAKEACRKVDSTHKSVSIFEVGK